MSAEVCECIGSGDNDNEGGEEDEDTEGNWDNWDNWGGWKEGRETVEGSVVADMRDAEVEARPEEENAG